MKSNSNIKCSVTNCAYHSKGEDCCSLSQIRVGCSCGDVTSCQGTECSSFQLSQGGR